MKRGETNQIEAYYRVATLLVIALLLWSVQTGILRMLLRIVKDLSRHLERAVPGNLVGDDGRPQVHRGQRHHNLEEAQDDQSSEQRQSQSGRDINLSPPRLTLSDGGLRACGEKKTGVQALHA